MVVLEIKLVCFGINYLKRKSNKKGFNSINRMKAFQKLNKA